MVSNCKKKTKKKPFLTILYLKICVYTIYLFQSWSCLFFFFNKCYFVAFIIKWATDQMDTRPTLTPIRANLAVVVVVVFSPGVTVGDFSLHIAGVGVWVLGHAAVVPLLVAHDAPLVWIT